MYASLCIYGNSLASVQLILTSFYLFGISTCFLELLTYFWIREDFVFVFFFSAS